MKVWWWWSRVLKNWRALGPWFQRRFRMLLIKSGVHWIFGFWMVWVRVCGSELRMTLVKVAASCGGGGGFVVVVREWRRSKYGGFGG